ncbi:MAG: serine protease [Alphaproteobacteria bacterium]
MKRFDIIVIVLLGLAVLAELLGVFETLQGGRPEPQIRRPAPEGDPLPPADPDRDPVVLIEDGGPPQNSIGTAFSLDSDGLWMTARHVVDGCDRVGIVTGPQRAVPVERIWEDPVADLAIFQDALNRPALSLSERLPVLGEAAYGVGYPQGEPREVSGRLIGRGISQTRGRGTEEPILVWAEERRFPDFDGTLGGISGGPLLSYSGEVLGVILSGSVRRGRFNTAAPEAVRTALAASRTDADLQGREIDLARDLDPETIRTQAERLRSEGTVSLVLCRVDGGARTGTRVRKG